VEESERNRDKLDKVSATVRETKTKYSQVSRCIVEICYAYVCVLLFVYVCAKKWLLWVEKESYGKRLVINSREDKSLFVYFQALNAG